MADNRDLRKRRKRLGKTLADVALALDRSPDALAGALSRWERGQGGIPRDITREDIERVIDAWERELVASLGVA